MDNKTWLTLEQKLKELYIQHGLEIETIGVQFKKSEETFTYTIVAREQKD